MCLLGLSCGAAHGEGVWPPAAMEIHDGAEWGLQWGLHTRELDVPQEGCVPEETLRWIRLLAGPVTLWGGHAGGPEPLRRTHPGTVCEKLQPVGRTHMEVYQQLSPIGGTPRWYRRWTDDEMNMRWTDRKPPFPVSVCRPRGGGREFVSEIELGKKGGVGRRCFNISSRMCKIFIC